jgi:hypothetical protein
MCLCKWDCEWMRGLDLCTRVAMVILQWIRKTTVRNLRYTGYALLLEKNFFLLIFCLSLSICFAVDIEVACLAIYRTLIYFFFFVHNKTVATLMLIFWYTQLIFPTVALWQWMIIPRNVGITLFRVALIVVLCKITEAYKWHQKIPKIFGSWCYANVTTIIFFEMFCGLASTSILRLNDRICLCFYGINPSYSFQRKKDARAFVHACTRLCMWSTCFLCTDSVYVLICQL